MNIKDKLERIRLEAERRKLNAAAKRIGWKIPKSKRKPKVNE